MILARLSTAWGFLITKPYADDELWTAIRTALAQEARLRARHLRQREIRARLASLTPLERKVLDLVIAGRPNKAIASEMEVSLRTVENRRHDVLSKMHARTVPELVRLMLEANRPLSFVSTEDETPPFLDDGGPRPA